MRRMQRDICTFYPTASGASVDRRRCFLFGLKRKIAVTLIGSDGAKHEMLWPKNEASQAWPASAPFSAGTRYQLMIGDIQMPLDLNLVAAPSASDDGKKLGGYLTAGCAAQADALMRAMAGG